MPAAGWSAAPTGVQKPRRIPAGTFRFMPKRYPPTYQLKVTLEGSKPPIWRRLQVPGNLTLAELHVVLQVAMGWMDGHLHEFEIGGTRYGDPATSDGFGLKIADEKKVTLVLVAGKVISSDMVRLR